MTNALVFVALALVPPFSPALRAETPQAPSTTGTRAAAATYPVVTFAYADLYDRFCSDVTKTPIEPAAIEEVQRRLGEFQDAWRREAPRLLEAVVDVTGAPFDFAETKAAISLCNPGSLSFPLIIDVRRFLGSLNSDQALPLDVFVATVFHETMHRYVNDRKATLPGGTTPLLDRYTTEPAPVRNHVHLLALFDAVYLRLGRQRDLERLIAQDARSSYAGVFKRARDIVGMEGAENVICEISRGGCHVPTKR